MAACPCLYTCPGTCWFMSETGGRSSWRVQGCPSHAYRAGPPSPILGFVGAQLGRSREGLSRVHGSGEGGCGAGGDWLPGLPWQDCLATRVLAATATRRWTSEEVSMGTHHLCAFQPLCLGAWGSRVVASVQVTELGLHQSLVPWQSPEGLRSTCDTASKKVLCFPLTALPGAGGTLATAHAIASEEQKALSQARPCSMLCLLTSPASPFCVCPGLHLEAAQTNQAMDPQTHFRARLTSVAPEEEDTHMLIMSIPGVHRS